MAMPSPASHARPRLTRDDVLDAREVAQLLHMPLSTVLDYARRGVIPGHKLGRRWVFLRDELEAGVRNAPSSKAAEPPQPAPQPPARQSPPRTRSRTMRYPQAVPSPATAQQQALFN